MKDKGLIKTILILNIIVFIVIIIELILGIETFGVVIGLTEIAIFIMAIIALINWREK